MAKLKVYTFPDAVLAQKAEPVQRVDKSFYKLADDMLETMYYEIGCGLAANQVGILKRILVVDSEFDLIELPKGAPIPPGGEVVGNLLIKNKKPQIIFNPEIILREGSVTSREACLSVPEYSAEVKRAEKIIVTYQDIDGVQRKISAEGYLATILQHEMDHLDGKLFIDRLSPLKKEMAKKKLKHERLLRDEEEAEIGFQSGPDKTKKTKGF
ncbi:MAG: peptide deformylase [Bdellovibrio sp.]|nr:peptide deformylase [Bdellovibrio sp.]